LSWAGTRNSRAVNFDLPAHFLFNFSGCFAFSVAGSGVRRPIHSSRCARKKLSAAVIFLRKFTAEMNTCDRKYSFQVSLLK
jgi:hypothetical protein